MMGTENSNTQHNMMLLVIIAAYLPDKGIVSMGRGSVLRFGLKL